MALPSLVTSDEFSHIDEGSRIVDGMSATMAGIIASKKTHTTKSSKMMAFVDMEDLFGNVEVIVFPNVYERYLHLIKEDAIVVVKGSVNFKEEEAPKLIAENITSAESLGMSPEGGSFGNRVVYIDIPPGIDGKETLEKIKDIILEHRGSAPVIVRNTATGKKLKTSKELWVEPNDEFFLKVEAVIGKGSVKSC